MPSALSQVPQGFNYQAIARNSAGDVIPGYTFPTVKFDVQTSLGVVVYEETFSSVVSNASGLITLAVGTGTYNVTYGPFSSINWKQPLYLKTWIAYPTSTLVEMGTSQIWAVPYSLIAKDVTGPLTNLGISATATSMNSDSSLFEVKNKSGQTVFAVYDHGVRVYVTDAAKSKKGGFAVGGFGTDKAGESTKYMYIDKDSARIYLDTNPLTKTQKGGFAVGGYDITKGVVQNYLNVSSDSVRIYIDSDPSTKKLKGGFAVGGYDMTKGTNDNYMNVNTDASGIINPSQNRVLWYPIKNAFLTGRVRIGTPDSVGVNSFTTGYESRSRGMYSQALGFKAIANGDYSTAIGKYALADKINSFAFGDSARASGNGSFAFGSWDVDNYLNHYPTEATSDNSIAIGLAAKASGKSSFSFGSLGFYSVIRWPDLIYARNQASGDNSMALGFANSATNSYSMIFGIGNTSTAYRGFSVGYNNYTNGDYSYAIGRQNVTMKAATSSTTLGYGLIANEPNSTIVGVFNDTLATNVQFAVGYGLPGMIPTRRTAMIILKNGNVGIGTTSPVLKLEVNGSTKSITPTGTAAAAGQFQAWTDGSAQGLRSVYSFYPTFQTTSDNTPRRAADMTSGFFGGSWGYEYLTFNVGYNGSVNDNQYLTSEKMRIISNGNVGIGTTTPGYKLTVNGTAWCSSGAWTGSDIRWKRDVAEINDVLSNVLTLKPVTYQWKTEEFPEMNFTDGRQIGLIAQDVEKIFPELVKTDNNGYKAVSYEKLSVVLLEGMKEQQTQIESQKSQIESQQKQIDELKTLIKGLQQR